MVQSISTKQNQDVSLSQTAIGIAGGALSGFAFRKVSGKIKRLYLENYHESCRDKYTQAEKDLFIQEANNMAQQSKIVQKGFKGIKLVNHNEKINLAENEIKNFRIFDKIKIGFLLLCKPIEWSSNILTGKFIKKSKKCENGFYHTANMVVITSPSTALHEVGHAINFNKNCLTKIPNILSTISERALIPAVILTAIFSNKPNKNENNSKEKSTLKKTVDFIHKHIGLTVAILKAPQLLEEGLASGRAIKFVNKSNLLSKAAKMQHNEGRLIAFGSYLLGTVILASSAKIVVSVKDKIINLTTRKHSNTTSKI